MPRSSVSIKGFHGYGLPVLSGFLLGVSFPSYPFIRLDSLAWVALVPLLVSLRDDISFRTFYGRVYSAMLLYCTITLWWVCYATLPGGVLTVIAQAFFLTIPLVVFFMLKRRMGYHYALFGLPFFWVAWEWLYMLQDLSLGWLVFGNSQALFTGMIQYADITGVWGVSFWLLCFNVIAVDIWFRFRYRKGIVLHAAILALMVLFSFGYSYAVFTDREAGESLPDIRVSLIQPNINPLDKWQLYSAHDVMRLYFSQTDRAMKNSRADLVIWPETAIPFYILNEKNAPYFEYLRIRMLRWNASLLSGFSDIVSFSDDDVAGKEYLYKYDPAKEHYYQAYNASMLVSDDHTGPQVYRKRKLVPFAERVPYMEYFPWLDNLTFSLAGISSWGKGEDWTIMEFSTSSGHQVKTANSICYESIFPGLVAEFVRRGAEFLTVITNDGWYEKSYGPYQHAAIARFRCIENRRSMARCANTGVSQFIDRFGRVYADVPWWQRTSLTAEVERSRAMTFYTTHPDLFAKIAVAVSGLFLVVALFFRGKTGGESTL